MNKSFVLRKEDRDPKWWIVDAQGEVVGRLATQIAEVLRGKNKPEFTPHTDGGDYVIVINADKILLTGNKLADKEYARYTGYIGGLKIAKAKEVLEKHPVRILEHAVKGMLPKNKLMKESFKKLKVYAGADHPHAGQNPETLVKTR